MKHVQKRGEIWRYRRKVPGPLREILGKGELVAPLGGSEQEAIRRYGRVHGAAEQTLADAKLRLAEARGQIPPRIETPLDRFFKTRDAVRALGFDPEAPASEAEWFQRSAVAESLVAGRPTDPQTGYPLDVAPVETALISALHSGLGKSPLPTLEDAKRLYLADRAKRSRGGDLARKKDEQRAERVVGHVIEALGKNPDLTELRRADARTVLDHMLRVVNSPSTVERYLNDIRAIINHALKEMDLGRIANPFTGLEVGSADDSETAKDKRRSLTQAELAAIRTRIDTLSRTDDLKHLWRILEGTGCRLAEVTGARTVDVVVDGELPHISVQWHEGRRIKTHSSRRKVPLVGEALEAAKAALKTAGEGALLFPRYGGATGPTSASGALMKHVRAVVKDRKAAVHSLRHNMKDRLRVGGVPKATQDMILGHASGGVGETYGSDEARLRVAMEAMRKAATE
ncbi:tyrosine-type recombinase/integrase [Mesorhizobium sp. CA14]|uniref:tyrosine-type recombinase/integrase n=1 Tax=Mesorhizobium sp. CA14 TaxID=2876642 RepID=UPI001CCA316E|nr:tyrosine-type recombinase/integrase [Mesorhizobium sp. CA14]MBZ9851219.1 tyrosine-type recombinase/integrase [Mesorhizobium sp. CA14]